MFLSLNVSFEFLQVNETILKKLLVVTKNVHLLS